ncbi:hypothetical protein KX729_33165 [Rhizobium sp. XQZ8]|uniref:hypothetical protein n=1 Tax=Rhizobium populisoli TaxID=2859785 RepID=UPI001CA4EDC3|nr:hypothetical protein [Rhizobium populisoli]MBW6426197.1 hypothetical protein [Rhizobium populisoli]
MTAINIIRLAESVHIFTDTKASLDGLAVGNVVKCLPIPHLSAAVATRGDAALLGAIHRTASQYATYDGLRAGIVHDVRNIARVTPHALERKALAGQWDAFIIGWGEHGPDGFGFFSHDLHGVPAFTIYAVQEIVITPVVPHEILDDVMATGNHSSIALLLMETQRRIYPEVVGGHMIETWIDADGIHNRSLKPFADVAFQPAPATKGIKLPAAFAKHQTVVAR